MERQSYATKDDFWRYQDAVNELSTAQSQQAERIMRLEKKLDDGPKHRNLWAPASPFPSVLGSSHNESSLNPAAEAFRNFDTDTGISALSLDHAEDSRRAAASRANSVRFDESANNHYGSSRQSIDLPTRTGSGLGSHPLSERSLSHRSDGRGSNAGFGRANSFGLEQSRLLGSINSSPKVTGIPPPGFFILGPCPSIVRCWLTETFSNDSLLYAALCTGAAFSTIGMPLLQKLSLDDQVVDEAGLRKIKLPVYLTEARIQQASSRPASPTPQVPTLFVKFVVLDDVADDSSIQILVGSDVLRAHCADILFSQDKLTIFDDDRNQLAIPLVRPEDDATYNNLSTGPRKLTHSTSTGRQVGPEALRAGVIGQPSKMDESHSSRSSGPQSPTAVGSGALGLQDAKRSDSAEPTPRSSAELGQSRPHDDSKSTTGSETSFSTPMSKSTPGVWGNSWRSASSTQADANASKQPSSSYSRPAPTRTMKVLRPTKAPTNAPRTVSSSNPFTNPPDSTRNEEIERKASVGEAKAANSTPTRNNPIGSGSAFGWLNPGSQRRATTNGN